MINRGLGFREPFPGVPGLFRLFVGGEFRRLVRYHPGRLQALGGQQNRIKDVGAGHD